MKSFFILSALFTTIMHTKPVVPESVLSRQSHLIRVRVDFAYDREKSIIFTIPYREYSDNQLQEIIAQRCSIATDKDGRLDHIQKHLEQFSPFILSYIIH